MRLLLQPGSRLVTAHLVLREQAARHRADAGAPGYRRWGATFHVSLGVRLPRSAFHPHPAVGARLVVIERRSAGSTGALALRREWRR